MNIDILIDLHFNQKLSLTQISKENSIDRNKLTSILVKSGYKPINYQNEKKLNQDIFDKIDTEEKAYWLGFIYADGSISHNVFELQLSNKDINHLNKFKKFLNWSNEIKLKDSTNSVRISFRNKYFTNQLKNLGVVERKSLVLTFPNEKQVPKKLIRHFIRGYFDGDGCIHFRKNVIKKSVMINLLGTPIFLSVLRTYIPIKVNKLYKNNGSDNTLVFQKTGNGAETFLYWLYNNSNIYLDRKITLYKKIEYGKIN